jgi:ABC-type molybdate transport system substrate-binding protein
MGCGLVGCVSGSPQAAQVRVAGASDVLKLAQAVQSDYQQTAGVGLVANPSKDAVSDLESGKADVALVGRELSAAESRQLETKAVAYDAVCILISVRTYSGGVEQGTVGSLIQPANRFDGLKNLTLDELKNHFANLLKLNGKDTYWYLPKGYFSFQPYQVADTLQIKEDPLHPGHALGTWVWNFAPLGGELTPVGLTDTQAFLLQKLDYDQVDLKRPGLGFTTPNIGSEEEWVSSRFDIAPGMEEAVSSWPFNFFLMPVSRQVSVRAVQHGFSVHALSIDGVDPLSDPQVIYTGDYPLARTIWVVAKKPVSPQAADFIQYLVSPQGQTLIKNASYLPLPQPGS